MSLRCTAHKQFVRQVVTEVIMADLGISLIAVHALSGLCLDPGEDLASQGLPDETVRESKAQTP